MWEGKTNRESGNQLLNAPLWWNTNDFHSFVSWSKKVTWTRQTSRKHINCSSYIGKEGEPNQIVNSMECLTPRWKMEATKAGLSKGMNRGIYQKMPEGAVSSFGQTNTWRGTCSCTLWKGLWYSAWKLLDWLPHSLPSFDLGTLKQLSHGEEGLKENSSQSINAPKRPWFLVVMLM